MNLHRKLRHVLMIQTTKEIEVHELIYILNKDGHNLCINHFMDSAKK